MDKDVWLRIVLLALAVAAVACGAPYGERQDGAELQQFFENARRREAAGIEREQVVRVPGCTAFFVENRGGSATIASARHCFNYSATSFCKGGGTFTTNDGQKGRCLEVVAGDATHDIVLFKAEMPFTPRREQTLRLAGFVPEVKTRLKMIGYPGDPERRGQLTVTEGCWVLKGDVPSPFADGRTRDPSALHNCSTYGGNSGGPMLIDGTRLAVGLPFTYVPGDFAPNGAENLGTAAHMARMADFVKRNRAALDAAGIVVAESATDTDTSSDRDLFVALAERSDAPYAYVSARSAVAQVVVCEGDVSGVACHSGVAGALVANPERTTGDRRLHATAALVAPAGGARSYTAVGRDAQGGIVSRMVFALEAR
jgi:hypothetical protein